MSNHPAEAYTALQKVLHWAVVALLLAQYLVFEEEMGDAFDATLQTGQPVFNLTSTAHIAIGVLVLVLALVRLGLRAKVGAPAAPADEPLPLRLLAQAVHIGLYAVLILLPLGGLAAYFIPSEIFGELHEVGTNVLLALAGLHVAGALVHQFWWKDGLIRRMI